ncbi:unnamed protein product [Rotaria magnacalcarata]|uniref:Uncharacterized protein n=1 Tax=Rotaria magnacalcarata TaxID=392030 RepID=A0A8S2NSY3_9BILA|nr:unnamed protein product [Rotaria magnacalcarata]
MPVPSRRKRNSSSESSNGLSSSSSSSDDEEISPTKLGKSTMNRVNELTLKDDEDTISFQAPLPEYYGKLF